MAFQISTGENTSQRQGGGEVGFGAGAASADAGGLASQIKERSGDRQHRRVFGKQRHAGAQAGCGPPSRRFGGR